MIDKFGNPSKTEDLSDFSKCKVFYYPGKDDFGNACMVKLQFVPVCQTRTVLVELLARNWGFRKRSLLPNWVGRRVDSVYSISESSPRFGGR